MHSKIPTFLLPIYCIIFVCLLTGCTTRQIVLVDFQTGQTINGKLNEFDRSIIVILPDGEVLAGKYSAISNKTAVFGTGFGMSSHSHGAVITTGVTNDGVGKVYGLLKSNSSSLMMEIVVSYSEWTGHGYGEAITNDGRKFKVQF